MVRVDVVIATYNRHASLQRTLTALEVQSFRDFRVFVADDGSSPPVSDTLSPALADRLDLAVLRGQNSGPSEARNSAVAAGTAPLVAFVDDDVAPAPWWLEAHLATLQDENIASIGPLLAPPGWKPTAWNRWEAERLAVEYRRMSSGEYAPTWRQFFTGNVLLSRELLTAAGPFRADFRRAEDIELALRLRRAGAHFVFTESAIGWHYARRPLGSWLALPRQYAEYDHRLAELHPEVAILTLVQRELGRRHPLTRRVAGLLERVPVLRAATVGAGVTAALGLDFVRAHALASRSLSLVYDLEYRAAFGSAARCAPSAGTPRDASA